MDKTFTAYINNAGDEWVQVTISGSGALELTEEAIEDALSLRAERDAAYRKGAEDMRERAAAWHEAKVAEYTDQIAANDAYLARSGRHSSESRANEYCDDRRSGHRRYAAAIRKLEATP